jgi:hypothetical protein
MGISSATGHIDEPVIIVVRSDDLPHEHVYSSIDRTLYIRTDVSAERASWLTERVAALVSSGTTATGRSHHP